MKKISKTRLLGVLAVLTFSLLFPVNSLRALVFLYIPPGSRARGMGMAFTAVSDDAQATYYNPAGLALQNSIDVVFNTPYKGWLPGLAEGMYYREFSGVLPLGHNWSVAPSFFYFTIGEDTLRDYDGTPLGTWTSNDVVAGVSVGYRITPGLGVGLTAKLVRSLLFSLDYFDEDYSDSLILGATIGIDFGGLQRISLPFHLGELSVGACVKNFGPPVIWRYDQEEYLPLTLMSGASYTFRGKDLLSLVGVTFPEHWLLKWLLETSRIAVSGDLHTPLTGRYSSSYNLWDRSWKSYGVELAPLGVFAFRFGYFEDEVGSRVGKTRGFGMDFKFLRIDYSGDSDIYSFETENHQIAVTVHIGLPVFKRPQ